MEWLNARSMEELKEYGKIKQVMSIMKKDIEELFGDKESIDKNIVSIISIKSNSWNGLYLKVLALREVICYLKDKVVRKDFEDATEVKEQVDIDELSYFINKESEYIFYLLELDGKQRADKLNITMKCYSDRKEAKKWRDNIAKVIHPNICRNERAHDAMVKLQQLYGDMVGIE